MTIYKKFNKRKFLSILLIINLEFIVKILINTIIVLKWKNFKQTNQIFVNLNSFGHSIIDTTSFFHVFGVKSICISVGSSQDRNKYFKELYKPYKLINFYLPNMKYNRIRLRVKVGNAIQKNLDKSFLLKKINPNLVPCVQQSEVVDLAAARLLENKYKITNNAAKKIIDELKISFKAADNVNGSSIQLLIGNKNNFEEANLKFLEKYLKIFQAKNKVIAKKLGVNSPKTCTLIVRRSKKAWSGVGIEGYLHTLNFLKEKNYIVHLIGDYENSRALSRKDKNMNLFTNLDYDLEKKIFEILTVFLSDFTFGDPSGAQCIPHFFNKRCLILNNIAVGQVHYNSEILPQIWKDQFDNIVSLHDHFDTLLYRQTPLKLEDGRILAPKFNDANMILACLNDFISFKGEKSKLFSKDPKYYDLAFLPDIFTYSENFSYCESFLNQFKQI